MNVVEEKIAEAKKFIPQQLRYLIGKGDAIIEFAVTPLFLNVGKISSSDRDKIEAIVQKMENYVSELQGQLEKYE